MHLTSRGVLELIANISDRRDKGYVVHDSRQLSVGSVLSHSLNIGHTARLRSSKSISLLRTLYAHKTLYTIRLQRRKIMMGWD